MKRVGDGDIYLSGGEREEPFADCETEIVLGCVVYTRKQTSGSVIVTLMKPYLNQGHSLFTDNYNSSPTLSTYLYENMTNSYRTVRLNRKHMPVLDTELKKGESYFKCSDNILVKKWTDRRDVSMITTMQEWVSLDKIDRATN